MDTYRVTVSVTVGKGSYGYDRICDREFQVVGTLDILEQIDLAPSVKNLMMIALADVTSSEDEQLEL